MGAMKVGVEVAAEEGEGEAAGRTGVRKERGGGGEGAVTVAGDWG